MSLFTSEASSILTNAEWLQPLSDPPGGRPLLREDILKTMALHLADLFTVGQARNLFIYGKPGTGKTACVKYVLKEVAKHASETKAPVLTAYVNAGKTRTPYYTLAEVVKQLGVSVPNAGWQLFRLKRELENMLSAKSMLIAIDEVDSILFKEKEPLVYYLNRQPKTTLILISNSIDDAVRLPERALSTLQPILIETQPYGSEEIQQILEERVEHALKPCTISDDLLTTIAKSAGEAGDIRFGLRILLSAALEADQAKRRVIDPKDVASAIEDEGRLRKIKHLEALRDQLLKRARKYGRD